MDIYGANFDPNSTIAFGSEAATDVSCPYSFECTVTTPAAPGPETVYVTVTSDGMTSPTYTDYRASNGDYYADQYSYIYPTTITVTSPIEQRTPFAWYGLRLSATLTSSIGPVAGVKIQFGSKGGIVPLVDFSRVLCISTTNAEGTATCLDRQRYPFVILGEGYYAEFGGNSSYASAATDTALIW
jgi:hypothetical protein